MKKLLILFLIFLLFFGCTAEKPLDTPTQQLSCCNRTIVEEEGRCILINPPADIDYDPATSRCDINRNTCNITLNDPAKGETTIEVPICGGEEDRSCVEADCRAMVCGNFLYRPQLPPPMPTEEEMKSGAAVPLTSGEESGVSLYKADCKFFDMDENLSKLLERTGSLVNSFRLGIGNNSLLFSDYEKYKYLFPPTDMFCSVNPTTGIDRYMNYFEMCAIPGACDSLVSVSSLGGPTAYLSKYECAPYTEGVSEENKLESRERYPFFYTTKESQETLIPSGYRVDSGGVFDSVFYRRALAAQYFDLMFVQHKTAPFECSSSECMSGNCNKQDYHRSFIVKRDGSKVPVECYYDYISGRKVAVCTSVENRSFEMLPDGTMVANITYTPIDVYALEMAIRDNRYDSKELTQPTGGDSVNMLTKLAIALATDRCGDMSYNTIPCPYTSYPSTLKNVAGSVTVQTRTIPSGFYSDIRALFTPGKSCSEDYGPAWLDLGKNVREEPLHDIYWCYRFQVNESNTAYPPARTVYFFNKNEFRIINEQTKTYDTFPIVYDGWFEGLNKPVIGFATGGVPSSPQESDIFQICNMRENEDYVVIDTTYFMPWIAAVENPRLSLTLMNLEDNQKAALAELVSNEDRASSSQIALASVPWALAFYKCKNDAGYPAECSGTWLQKPEYVALARNNVFALPQNETIKMLDYVDFTSNSDYAAELHMNNDGTKTHYVLASRYLTLIFGLGDCELDEQNNLPVLEEYGWCEPCTYATMAYGKAPVEPEESEEGEDGGLFGSFGEVGGSIEYAIEWVVYSYQRIITYSMLTNYLKNGILPIVDFRDANSRYLSDPSCHVSENGLTIACDEEGSIRTYTPYSYSIITEPKKEVKGVGPVIALIGYDRTGHSVDPARALEESRLVKSRCENCLVAVPFFASSASYMGGEYIWMNYVDQDAYSAISDIWAAERDSGATTFDAAVVFFPVAEVMRDYAALDEWDDMTAKEKADVVVDRMYSYAWTINHISRGIGKKQPVPVVIVFNINTSEGTGWPAMSGASYELNKESIRRIYADFFSTIYLSRDKLRKAGIIGIVYSPFSSDEAAIVREQGSFDSKFCSFQEGTYDFIGISTLTTNIALYPPEEEGAETGSSESSGDGGSKGGIDTSSITTPSFYHSDTWEISTAPQYDFQVAPGGSTIWYVADGDLTPSGYLYCEECPEGEYCPDEAMVCEDGTTCVPRGGTSGPYKCPKGVISNKCRLCSDIQDEITCLMRSYSDGAHTYFKNIPYSELTEADADIIGLLPKEDRCCLMNPEGRLYTFKRLETNAINTVPVVFSGNFSGTPQNNLLQDCGFTDPTIITAKGELKICGITKTPDEPLECKKSGNWFTYNK